eukprot:TRINITY_DN6431_c0_g1_i1.p1 TRINITY_DN6431_c0_g1~~TRINITY_DN6431_c0_g1_i1.p1  ORF type:complete len:320 (+),score=56.64 TRINITY_DN6431_c0_g1_i1:28-987(+)
MASSPSQHHQQQPQTTATTTPTDKPPRKQVSPLLSGGIGVAASILTSGALYPLDVIKVRVQAKANKQVLSKALREVVATSYKQNGIRSFYDGFVPGLIGPAAAWGSYMLIYKAAQQSDLLHHLMPRGSPQNNFVSGMLAGVGMTLITNPIFVVKTRMQTAPAEIKYSGLIVGIRTIIKTEGFKGLYRGLGAALPLTAHSAVHWTIFESMKDYIRTHWHAGDKKAQMTSLETFAAVSGSKVIAAALTYPLHVLKTCLQVHRTQPDEKIRITTLAQNIYRHNGVRGFYSGFVPHLARTVPNATVTMYFIEKLTQMAQLGSM